MKKSNNIPIKKLPSKKTIQKFSEDQLKNISRDPAGRVQVHKQEEFKLPVPGTITSLRRFVPKSQGPKQQKEVEQGTSNKLSDYL